MMRAKVNIACLYWVGDFRERNFKPDDVRRLYASVHKNIDRPFEFFVLTNDMSLSIPEVNKIPLAHADDWPGWWGKMELYRPDILPKRRTLYMDLDSHAIRSLQPILDYEGGLVMFNTKDKKHRIKHKMQGIGGMVYRFQAATILYNPWEYTWLYEKFLQDDDYYLEHFRSDQDILGEWLPKDQPVFPDQWLMKMGTLERTPTFRSRPPNDVIIVTGQTKSGGFRKTHEIPWFEKMARG